MMKYLLTAFFLLFLASCIEKPITPDDYSSFGRGAYIVNEGNFNSGNGSVSFFSYDSAKVLNDLFFKKNSRPLGDVPNSMTIQSETAYIVVNNSGKIEIADARSMASTGIITGLNSPRNIAMASNAKAYVTSLWSDSVTIINLADNSVSGWIDIGRTSESILVAGAFTYITSWMGDSVVTVINNTTDEIVDRIVAGPEPESLVLDNNFDLWVLCTGGWMKEKFPELVRINTITNKVDKRYVFPSKSDSPTCLRIDGLGKTLYYIDKGVRKMDIGAQALPSATLIPQDGNFYKFGINPVSSDIIVTDAADYVGNGYVSVYRNDGTLLSRNEAGIIPGDVCFNFVSNGQQVR